MAAFLAGRGCGALDRRLPHVGAGEALGVVVAGEEVAEEGGQLVGVERSREVGAGVGEHVMVEVAAEDEAADGEDDDPYAVGRGGLGEAEDRTHWNNIADALLAPTGAEGNPTGPPTMLDENLNHYPIFLVPGLGSLPETSEVIPGCAWMGVAAAVHIGRQTGDRSLIAKALQMGEAVANHIYDDGLTTKGYAFATPESWFVDEVNQPRFTGYTRPRSIWQIIDTLNPGAGRPRLPRPGHG